MLNNSLAVGLLILAACRKPDGHEVTTLVEVPRMITSGGGHLVVSAQAVPSTKQAVYFVFGDGNTTLIATLGEGKLSVDGDIVYYADASTRDIIAVNGSGSADALTAKLSAKSFVAVFGNGVYALNDDFPPKLVRIDAATGTTAIRTLPGLGDRYLGPTIAVPRGDALYVADRGNGYTFRIDKNGDVDRVANIGKPLSCFTTTDDAAWWFAQGGQPLAARMGGSASAVNAPGLGPPGDPFLLCAANSKVVFYTTDNRRAVEMRAPDGTFRRVVSSQGDISALFADEHALYWAESQTDHYSLRSISLP